MTLVCIDHHPDSSNSKRKFDLMIKDTTATSTCQLIAEQFLKEFKELPKFIARVLLMGILADSGGLRYIDAKNAYVLSVVEKLIKYGSVNMEVFERKIFSMKSDEFKIIKILIKNAVNLKIKKYPGFTYSYLPDSIINKYKNAPIENAYHIFTFHFIRMIRGYPWGVLLSQKRETVQKGIIKFYGDLLVAPLM